MNKVASMVQRRAMTMVELLVAVAIVSVLATLGFASWSMALESSKKTAEISAARACITTYLLYPVENNGRLMPGVSSEPAPNGQGGYLPGYLSKRWPGRMAELFNHQYEGLAVVNEAQELYREGGVYMATLNPSMGLNTTFVGGNYERHFTDPVVGQDEATYGQFAVTRVGQAVHPSKLIVFVSASSVNFDGSPTYGNFYVLSPRLTTRRWVTTYKETTPPTSTGFVHPRWNGQAVAAHLDGSVAMLDYNELRDMTRWSNQAAQANDPNWSLGD